MSDLYPFDSHYLDRGGLRYHYLDEGPRDGEPVVMLHGNPTWSFYYRNLVLALRSRYRCIVPDHIGMGLSDKPGDSKYSYTLESRVEDLAALLDHLKIKRNINLVLHDWGGMIGMTYAVRHAKRIRRFVILNTGAFHLPRTKRMPRRLTLCRTPVLGSLLVRGGNAFAKSAVRQCVTREPLADDVASEYLRPYDSWNNRIATLRFVEDIPLRPGDRTYDVVSEVEQKLSIFKKKRMLICWGMRDFVFDHHFLGRWEHFFPYAVVHRYKDAGHYILEDAGDEVVPLIEKFLDRGE